MIAACDQIGKTSYEAAGRAMVWCCATPAFDQRRRPSPESTFKAVT
jgi:hypothetical protein